MKQSTTRFLLASACLALVACQVPQEIDSEAEQRLIEFTTDEGTFMSLDISPDGEWIYFDMMGHIYRMPASGGDAECITQDTGAALNFHPAIGPDSKTLAFVSDRGGQDSLWLMDMDGSDPRLIFDDPETRWTDPSWSRDGNGVYAVRHAATPGRGWHRRTSSIWFVPLDGSNPELVTGGTDDQYYSPSVSPDGRVLYYHVSYFSGNRYGTQSGHHLESLDLVTGERTVLSETVGQSVTARDFQVTDISTMPPDIVGEFSPLISPDGTKLAFAREDPNGKVSWKGHEFETGTGLYVRDLETNAETLVSSSVTKDLSAAHAIYSYRVFPGYAWSADSSQLYFAGDDGQFTTHDLSSGETSTIRFQATVRREIAPQVRGTANIDDARATSKYIQWPISFADNRRTVFVAFGQLWVTETNNTTATLLHDAGDYGQVLTPALSPDETEVLFTTWSEDAGGHIWRLSPDGGAPEKIAADAGRYIHPRYSHDTSAIYVTAGPPANNWQMVGGWHVARIDLDDGSTEVVTELPFLQQADLSESGRLYFQYQEDPAAANLYRPFPDATSLAANVRLRSVGLALGDVEDHALLPPISVLGMFPYTHDPKLSPSGEHVAYRSGGDIYVVELARLETEDDLPRIVTEPRRASGTATRLSFEGGNYHRWLDDTTVEFASGSTLMQVKIDGSVVREQKIDASVSKDPATSTLVLANAHVVTMHENRILDGADIVVRGARILCVGSCEDYAGDRIIDLAGKTVIPGIVDVHSHNLFSEGLVAGSHWRAGALNLAYGVTTTHDPAVLSEHGFPLAEMVEAGRIVGPRAYTTAETVNTQSYALGDKVDIDTIEEARRQVAQRANSGAVAIKNFRLTSRRQNQLLIQAAREAGLSITGEGGPLYFNASLAMDGQTGWEHSIAHLPLHKDATTFFGQAGVMYSPTLIVAGHMGGSVDYYRPRHDFQNDQKLKRFLSQAELDRYSSNTELKPASALSYGIHAQGLADIMAAGGRGAIGEHGEQPGLGHHWEIWSYAAAISSYDALKLATLDGAWFLGLEDEIGSIVEGKIADLIVLNSDPLEDIENTINIEFVMKEGRLYDDETLDQLWPESVQ